MRFALRCLVVAGTFMSLFVASAQAGGEHTRVTYPGAISAEILGRSMLYTVGYDQVLNDWISAGVGIGSVSTVFKDTDIDAGKTAVFVPVYMNYYFLKEGGSPFVTGGLNLITNHSSVKGLETSTGSLEIPSSSIMPVFGLGYENRGDNGFLFRVTGYLLAGKSMTPWVGFTFGFAF